MIRRALLALALLAPLAAATAQTEAEEDAACQAQATSPEGYRACRNRGTFRIDPPGPGDSGYTEWLERRERARMRRLQSWHVLSRESRSCTPLAAWSGNRASDPGEALALIRRRDPNAGYMAGAEWHLADGTEQPFVEIYSGETRLLLANSFGACRTAFTMMGW